MWYWIKILTLVFLGAVVVWLAYEVVTFPAISRLRTENPTTSSMIEFRLSEARAEGREQRKFMIWTPIEQISPHLHRAVLAGEDTRFFQHDGFDWEAIQSAWDEAVREGEIRANIENKKPHIGIGENTLIRRSIIDKNVRIGSNVKLLNLNNIENYDAPDKSLYIRDGIIIVPKNAVILDGTEI